MKALVFVPGIMGTELITGTGEIVWPPTPLETQFGYKRVDKLLGEDVHPGKIIENVMCFDFYGSLFAQFNDIGFRQIGEKRLYQFPYDWRLDLERTAKDLAAQLDAVELNGAEEIFIVAHSMGGLISRLVLETAAYVNRPWFSKIKSFIALATPHQGAPLALARVLGLDSTLGISKEDFRKLANDSRYPSGYQLLPAPNEAACWSKEDLRVGVVDIYNLSTAERLKLNTALIARARFVHDSLAQGTPPAHVRYFYFAGTGHETVTRVNVLEQGGSYPTGEMVVTRTEDAGDGTVPFWSAMPRAVQKQIVVNEHTQVFRGMPFKRVFYRLLGGDLGPPLEALGIEEERPLQLSIPTPIIQCNQPFELLLVPSAPSSELVGKLVLQKLKHDGQPAPQPAEELSRISYTGPRVSRLRLLMPAIVQPGLYGLTYAGEPRNSDELRFAIVSLPGS